MKITKENFKKMIISEVKEMAKKEGWINELNHLNECDCGCETCSTENPDEEDIEKAPESIVVVSLENPEAFETVAPKELTEPLSESVKPQEVKKLAVELSRMKELLGLKNPLLGVK